MKKWLGRLLLAFVLVTIGFSLGSNSTSLQPAAVENNRAATNSATENTAERASRITVYSAHTTIRCFTCNEIESQARELLSFEFADEIAKGVIDFKSVDYSLDAAFAKKYNISSSTLIITLSDGNKEITFERLDEVWTKIQNKEEFNAYIRAAVNNYLAQIKEPSR